MKITEEIKDLDFYVIEHNHRLKIGVSKGLDKRIKNIKNAAGLPAEEINVLFFPGFGYIESRLKRLFKPYQIQGEWYNIEGIVWNFLFELKYLKKNPDLELFNALNIKNQILIENDEKEKAAIVLLEKIKTERKGIGFPNSIDLRKFIRTKRASYRHWEYLANEDFSDFIRKPKFNLENILNKQAIECLKILKNNTYSASKKNKYDNLITELFDNSSKDDFKTTLKIIENNFFQEN